MSDLHEQYATLRRRGMWWLPRLGGRSAASLAMRAEQWLYTLGSLSAYVVREGDTGTLHYYDEVSDEGRKVQYDATSAHDFLDAILAATEHLEP